jgi:hypothetical protein
MYGGHITKDDVAKGTNGKHNLILVGDKKVRVIMVYNML